MVEISVKSLKRVDIVSVAGRVDSSTAGDLDTALKGLLERGRHRFVLDCDQLSYISSAGLRVMVSALKEARSHNGGIVLARTGEAIRDTLSLVGFQSLFPQYADVIDAVDSF
jgi:anti-sigma B factor antagonist